MAKVRDFTPADAAGLAKCINESEGGWPGGITGGTEHTAEHVLEDYERDVNLTWLVVVTDDEQIAGISTLHPHFDDPEAAYLGFLNVDDAHRKKGFGKALLVESVNRVTAKGLKRLFLHTWGGNLNAVPVYKRTGFFWRPETQVLMENYIPTILKLPIAEPFFKRHNWYATYDRKIELKPDEMKHRGLNVYEYRWKKGDDFLRVTIDRESRNPTLIETNDLLVECWIAEPKTTLGRTIPVSWNIQNKSPDTSLECQISVKLPEGFQLLESPTPNIIVPPKKSIILSGVIQGQVSVVPPPMDKPALALVTDLSLGNTPVKLETGIRAKHPIQISTLPPSVSCRPGNRFTIAIAIKSNLKEPATGRLFIRAPQRLKIDQKEFNLTLTKEGYSGIELQAIAESSLGTMALPLKLQADLDVKGQPLKTREETIFVHCLNDGGVLVTPDQDGQRLQVHTETLHFSINLSKGAHIDRLANRLTDRVQIRSHCRDSVGPPFWPSEQMRTHFKHKIERLEDGTTRIIAWMTCLRYAGLVFSKTFILTGKSSVLGIQYGFENTDPKKTHEIRLMMNSIPGLWDHLHVLPLKAGLLREEFIEDEFFASDREVPKKREDWAETWYCAESPHRGEVVGVLCHPSILHEASGRTLVDFQLQVPTLPPGKEVVLPPVYLVIGMGTWHHIRRLWHQYFSEEPMKPLPTKLEPHGVVDIQTEDFPLLREVKSNFTIQLQIRHLVHRPEQGSLHFSVPRGWQITPRSMRFRDLKHDNPLVISTKLQSTSKSKVNLGLVPISVQMKTKLQTRNFELPMILHRESGKVTITQVVEQDQDVYIIDNGKYLIKVAPSFAGSVFAWINKETGTNYLESNFPKAGPRVWFNPWYGGIQYEPFTPDRPGWFPTKLDRENWTATEIQRKDWQGVAVRVTPGKEERPLKGLKLELQILTQPKSNLVALISQAANRTRAPRQIFQRLRIAIPSKDTTPKLETVIPRVTRTYRRKRVQTHAWPTTTQPYLGVEHGPDDATLVFTTNTNPRTELYLGDLNPEFVYIQTEELIDISPGETIERSGFLVTTPLPWQQAKLYGVLSKLRI